MQPTVPSIAVVPIEAHEVGDWIAWRREVITTVFGPQDETTMSYLLAENERYLENALEAGEHLAVFALQQDIRIGCGSICFHEELPSPDNPSGRCAYLMNIYVRPEYRRHGIGRVIVSWLVDQARIRGITKIYLESTIGAKPLYRSMGFADMPDYMVYTGTAVVGSAAPVNDDGMTAIPAPGMAPMMPAATPAMAPMTAAAASPMATAAPVNPYPGMPQQWRGPNDVTAAIPPVSGNPLAPPQPAPVRPDSSQTISYLLDEDGDQGSKKPVAATAVISFVLSLLAALSAAVPFVGLETYLEFIEGNEWLFLVASAAIGLIAIIFGIAALVKTSKKGAGGRGLAMAGVVVGAIACVLVGTLWATAATQPSLFDFDVSGFYSLG